MKVHIALQMTLLLLLIGHERMPMAPLSDLPAMRQRYPFLQCLVVSLQGVGQCACGLAITVWCDLQSVALFSSAPGLI